MQKKFSHKIKIKPIETECPRCEANQKFLPFKKKVILDGKDRMVICISCKKCSYTHVIKEIE